eukprot:m.206752 g.206752  ORF g.206752 m.206752 type:complete len:77 (+) comp32966_c0_seq2:1764-1994(+)
MGTCAAQIRLPTKFVLKIFNLETNFITPLQVVPDGQTYDLLIFILRKQQTNKDISGALCDPDFVGEIYGKKYPVDI